MKNSILSAAVLAVLSGGAIADTDIDLQSTSSAGTEVGGLAVAGNLGPGVGYEVVTSGAHAWNNGYASVSGFGIVGPNGGFGTVESGAYNWSGGTAGVLTIGNGIGNGYGEYNAGGFSIGEIDIDLHAQSPVDNDPPNDPPGNDNGGGNGNCNNGVGNGLDCQPPGNPPINDGPGTGPGNPGNQGGGNGNGNNP